MSGADFKQHHAALAEELRKAHVGRFSDQFAELAKPAIELTEHGAAGLSKLGGRPDLPPGLKWPWREELTLQPGLIPFHSAEQLAFFGRKAPLSFIAQIDLGNLAESQDLPHGVPDHGLLYLFYDYTFRGHGPDPTRQSFRTLWTSTTEEFKKAELPEAGLHEFPETALGARTILDPFETTTLLGADITLPMYRTDPDALNAYYNWSDRTRAPIHKLGGWPNTVQDEMEETCALWSHGIERSTADEGGVDPILDEPNDWRLLLQITSSGPSHMEWDDAGTLFIWIRERDVAARNFDNTCVILQSG